MKIIFLCLAFYLQACTTTSQKLSPNQCENYEPHCHFFGGRKECSYNSSGCKSCTCIPADNPNFNQDIPNLKK